MGEQLFSAAVSNFLFCSAAVRFGCCLFLDLFAACLAAEYAVHLID
jgi:hypothetical protein